jgi:hypothetical protein
VTDTADPALEGARRLAIALLDPSITLTTDSGFVLDGLGLHHPSGRTESIHSRRKLAAESRSRETSPFAALKILVGPERIDELSTAVRKAASEAAEQESIAQEATRKAERLRRTADELKASARSLGLTFPDIM